MGKVEGVEEKDGETAEVGDGEMEAEADGEVSEAVGGVMEVGEARQGGDNLLTAQELSSSHTHTQTQNTHILFFCCATLPQNHNNIYRIRLDSSGFPVPCVKKTVSLWQHDR